MPAKTKAKFGQKSAFVRSLPAATPAADVVEAAKKKGIKITPSLVYNIRSTSKASGSKKSTRGPKTGRKGRRQAGAGRAEIQLRNAIAALGLDKTHEILKQVEAAFAGR